jgi:CRISPR-associated endonuclease Csn1
LLKKSGVIDDKRFFKRLKPTDSTWQLRVAALDRALTKEEFARVIYHICKRRGFYWISKAESDKKENGEVKKSLSRNEELMRSKDYRTAAETILRESPQAQRNKDKDYNKSLPRVLLAQELQTIFEKQRSFGLSVASVELEKAILGEGDRKSGLFWAQKPVLSGEELLKMLGKCTFEKTEFRAPKNSYSAERHVLLTRINNLRIVVDGRSRELNDDERKIAIAKVYGYANAQMTYKQLRDALVKAKTTNDFSFVGVKDEDEKLIKLPAFAALKKALKDRFEAVAGDPNKFDAIATVLSIYKEDDEKREQLNKLGLDEEALEALAPISFSEFHSLSLKALRKILPHMELGDRYDQAVIKAGYKSHSDLTLENQDEAHLPPIYIGRDKNGRLLFNDKLDIPRNPVVLRAVNQARKVLSAVVKKYGRPRSVHIEMARDLSRPLKGYWTSNGRHIKGRDDILKEQTAYRATKEKELEDFKREYSDFSANKNSFKKWRLYREQQCKCAYSLEDLDIERVLSDDQYTQIDHIWPYSRSYDDSNNNKVLVKTKENQDKGDQTPFEYFGRNSERWRKFEEYVKANPNFREAKRDRLLSDNFNERAKEFSERNLNDTRYICRFFKNYVEQTYLRSNNSDVKRVVVLSGQLTAFLRARWGLVKARDESDRHHALDAAVIAACSHGMVKRLSDYARRKELGHIDQDAGEIISQKVSEKLEKEFPTPYKRFREEIANKARALFVSRAPQRRNGGAAHKETVYAKSAERGYVVQKIDLKDLKLSDLEHLVDPERNKSLYDAIRIRLERYGGNANKAFEEPLYKPSNDPLKAPIVRKVKTIKKLSGIEVRSGIAKNDTMLRVDIFRKNNKFYLIPIYVWHKAVGALPNKAIIQGKEESDWTLVDESFEFCLSLYPNDLARITTKSKVIFGYYSSTDRSNGRMTFHTVDRSDKVDIEGLLVVKGAFRVAKGEIQAIEKFDVDCLGAIYPAKKESRRGLA